MTPFKLYLLTVLMQGNTAIDHKLNIEPFENPCYATEKGMSGTSIIDRQLNVRIITRARCIPDGAPIPDFAFGPSETPNEPPPPIVRKGYPEDYPPPRPCLDDPILNMLPGRCR